MQWDIHVILEYIMTDWRLIRWYTENNILYRFVHFNRFQLFVFKHYNCRRRWKESKDWLKSSRYEFKTTICFSMIFSNTMKHSWGILVIPTSFFGNFFCNRRANSLRHYPNVPHFVNLGEHFLNSFFERHSNITFQLYKKPADTQLLQARKPCYIPIQDLPRLKSIRYLNATSNLNANDIEECNLKLWTTVTALAPNLYEIKFPSGKLVPVAPINAWNDRVYYKRERTNAFHHA